ncbi:unnamed protein product [Pleuronectes platessa]|uniref:Uncharacterized protein n=1 Tax=Pleuronectes platessa TaxID=8262 RepID=A0A9N7VEA5_PLEPL|nr:unnamed protein product [Pleuronectes platessa]
MQPVITIAGTEKTAVGSKQPEFRTTPPIIFIWSSSPTSCLSSYFRPASPGGFYTACCCLPPLILFIIESRRHSAATSHTTRRRTETRTRAPHCRPHLPPISLCALSDTLSCSSRHTPTLIETQTEPSVPV